MLKKIKNKQGSAMQVAIIGILLVGFCSFTVTSMVINQIKTNSKSSQNTILKYETEEGIDETIAKFIENINITGNVVVTTEADILQMYVKLADTIVGSNGIVNAEINNILNNMDSGIFTRSDLDQLAQQLGYIENDLAGNSNKDAKQILGIAKEYAEFFRDTLFDPKTSQLDVTRINYKACQKMIKNIFYNLQERVFESGNGANKKIYDGNIGVVYRDITLNNNKYSKELDKLYNTFIKDSYIKDRLTSLSNIKYNTSEGETVTDSKIKDWARSNVSHIIKEIKDTDYETAIKNEISRINKGGYIKESQIIGLYKTTGKGQVNVRNLVIERLDIVKREIDMLIQWLTYMDELSKDVTIGGSSSSSTGDLIVSVPKEIKIEDNSNKEKVGKVTHYTINSTDVTFLGKDASGKYKFEILKTGLTTKIDLKLKTESQVQDSTKGNYKIESNVIVKINKILGKHDYNVDYEIADWNKVNIP